MLKMLFEELNTSNWWGDITDIDSFIKNSAYHWDNLKDSIDMANKHLKSIKEKIKNNKQKSLEKHFGGMEKELERMLATYTGALELENSIKAARDLTDIPSIVEKSKYYEIDDRDVKRINDGNVDLIKLRGPIDMYIVIENKKVKRIYY